MTALWLLLAPCLPLALAFALAIKAWRPWVPAIAPWTALPSIVMPLLLEPGTVLALPWLVLGARLGLDSVSAPLMLGTGILWFAAAWYAWLSPGSARLGTGFWLSFLAGWSGFAGILVAHDMLSFFVFYALMGFAAYGLVIHAGDAAAKRASRVYITLLVIGETTLFAALLLAAFASGDLQFTAMGSLSPTGIMTALIVFGFGIKAGLLPVHVSLPLIYTSAPTPGAVVLAGAMINGGLVGWLRFLPLSGNGDAGWGAFLVAAGLAATFYGVLVGITQSNPRTLLAYSSISQMGLVTVGLGAGLMVPDAWPAILPAVLLYAVHHALAKGALFLGLGLVSHGPKTVSARQLIRLSLWLPALTLAGLPLTSGALAKTALKAVPPVLPEAWPTVLGLLLPLSSVATTLLVMRFLTLIPTGSQQRVSGPLYMVWSLVLLAGLVVPWVWSSDLGAAAIVASPKGLWTSIWPIAVGMLLTLSAVAALRHWNHLSRTEIPAGDVLILVEMLTAATQSARRQFRAPGYGSSAPAYAPDLTARLGDTLRHLERYQREWATAALAFLLVLAVVLLLPLF